MDKWGYFYFDGYTSDEAKNQKFAEYGIITDFHSANNYFTIKFSDETETYRLNTNGSYHYWLVNDSKKLAVMCSSTPIPWNSHEISIIEVFMCGIYPLLDGSLKIVQQTSNYSGGLSSYLNIRDYLTETEPNKEDLVLVPVFGITRANSGEIDTCFKDLYFCYQRQFKPNDKIITSNGEKYISLGGWLLFKM